MVGTSINDVGLLCGSDGTGSWCCWIFLVLLGLVGVMLVLLGAFLRYDLVSFSTSRASLRIPLKKERPW